MGETPLRLVFLGPPGAGKGTQAALLSAERSFAHISTGDMLREAAKRGTEIGRKAETFMKKGLLVPDEVVIAAVRERLRQSDARKGFVLDGFPRTLEQAKALEAMLQAEGLPLHAAVDITLGDEAVITRIAGRRTCPKCNRIYHVVADPPKKQGICDTDGEKLLQRADDREETVRERLAVYHRQTAPVASFYRERKLYRAVSSDGDLKEVGRRLGLVLSTLAT